MGKGSARHFEGVLQWSEVEISIQPGDLPQRRAFPRLQSGLHFGFPWKAGLDTFTITCSILSLFHCGHMDTLTPDT